MVTPSVLAALSPVQTVCGGMMATVATPISAVAPTPSPASSGPTTKKAEEEEEEEGGGRSRRKKRGTAGPFPATTLAISALAIDAPSSAPALIAWEDGSALPPPAEHEVPVPPPHVPSPPGSILREPLRSELDSRAPPAVLILDPAAVEGIDWTACRGGRVRHRRDGDEGRSRFSFRVRCWSIPSEPDGSILPRAFGVTERGATLNGTGVNRRSRHHSEECTLRYLSRRRDASDYFDVLQNPFADRDGGPTNRPALFTVFMDTYRVEAVVRSTERDQKRAQESASKLLERNGRKAMLAAKIRAATELLEKRAARKREDVILGHSRDGSSRPQGVGATDESGEGAEGDETKAGPVVPWEQRLRRSVIVFLQNLGGSEWEWEERLDLVDRRTFYRNTDPAVILDHAASWTPPEGWDRNRADRPMFETVGGGGGASSDLCGGPDLIGGRAAAGPSSSGTLDAQPFRPGDLTSSHRVIEGEDERCKDTERRPPENPKDDYNEEVRRVARLLTRDDDFVKSIARRLGVPERRIRGLSLSETEEDDHRSLTGEDPIINSSANVTADEVKGSHVGSLPTDLIQDYAELYAEKMNKAARQQVRRPANPPAPDGDLRYYGSGDDTELETHRLDSAEMIDGSMRGYGWRRLPRAMIGADFFRLNRRKLQPCPTDVLFNRCNKRTLVGMVDPLSDIDYSVNEGLFKTKSESIFIGDISADRQRLARQQRAKGEDEDAILSGDQERALRRILNVALEEDEGKEAEKSQEEGKEQDQFKQYEGGGTALGRARKEGGRRGAVPRRRPGRYWL